MDKHTLELSMQVSIIEEETARSIITDKIIISTDCTESLITLKNIRCRKRIVTPILSVVLRYRFFACLFLPCLLCLIVELISSVSTNNILQSENNSLYRWKIVPIVKCYQTIWLSCFFYKVKFIEVNMIVPSNLEERPNVTRFDIMDNRSWARTLFFDRRWINIFGILKVKS